MLLFWREFTLDKYDRRSRLQPGLVVALPIIFSALAWFPDGIVSWGTVGSLLAYGGGAALLVQIARDKGKAKEQWLFDRWGGKPTTRLLRHRDAPNQVILKRRHRKLGDLVPNLDIPTAEEEKQNPDRADEIYDAGVSVLREKTRDNELVFEENCNYGFRRNLWGMKPIGIVLASFGTLAAGVRVYQIYAADSVVGAVTITALGVNLIILLVWIFWITPSWVRTAADAYASQLLASSLDTE